MNLSTSPCALARMFRHEAIVITMSDVRTLREEVGRRLQKSVERPSGDSLLFYAANSELCSTVSLAWCVDQYDPDLLIDQERFKAAFAQFRELISNISNTGLRYSVELPDEYVRSVEENFFLNYARPREGGRPVDWRKDEFYVRLLTLYQMFSGQRPAGTEGGPSIRFMRAIVEILRRQLDGAADRSGGEYEKVDRLWRLPRNDAFLKEWFRTKGGPSEIQRQVDAFVAMNIAAFERSSAARPVRNNVIRGVFGGENVIE